MAAAKLQTRRFKTAIRKPMGDVTPSTSWTAAGDSVSCSVLVENIYRYTKLTEAAEQNKDCCCHLQSEG